MRAGALAAFVVLALALGCTGGGGGAGPRAVPVTVATVTTDAVPEEIDAIGHVEPSSTVDVHALVSGELVRVGFTEGQQVREGDVLFVVDPAPYQAAVARAEGDLARQQADADQLARELERYETLSDKSYVSADELDKLRSSSAAAQAGVRAAAAALESARLDLKHCTLRSPIDGRTGELLVHAGNLVRAGDTSLVVIHQLAPVYVAFVVPERYAPEILARTGRGETLTVTSTLTRGGDETRTGTLTFVDNAVDPTTGTLALKASFPNEDGALWPGQSTSVVLTLSVQQDAVVVPSQVVQDGQQGPFAYVVGANQTVDVAPLTVDRTVGTRTVVSQGLSPGDVVVVDGQLLLKEGATVAPKPASEDR